MRLHRLPCSLSRAGLLTEPTPAARRNVFMDPEHVEDMLAHAAASFSLQLQKQDRVSISANAVREMLDELMTGDVSVIDDTPVMRMPDGYMTREYGEWVAIVPALEGWVDCMQRITPGLSSGAIVDLGNLLRAGEEITPELVMVARIQLEDQIQAMKRMPIGAINAAVESTKSDWRKEEKLKEETEMNARDKAPTLPAIDGTINAAHGLLMAATDALSADQVAAMLKTTKKTATAQLKELQGLGFLESELRKGGTRYFRLVVAPDAKPGNPVVEDDGCGACGDACASREGGCRVKEESPPICESVQTGSESQAEDSPISDEVRAQMQSLNTGVQWLAPEDYEMPPADPVLLASANRTLSDRLEGVAHALRGCGLPALAEISGAEDLQMATAALSGAYQMALVKAAELSVKNQAANFDLSNIGQHLGCDLSLDVPSEIIRAIDTLRAQIADLTASVTNTAELHKQITSLATDVTNTRRALNDALNEADRMRTELAIERQARQALQEQINAAPAVAPLSYKVECSGLIYIKNASDRAIKEAERLAKLHGCPATITANVPFGTVRVVKGVEFKAAKAA